MCCIIIFTTTIYSCNSTKFLEDGELLVVENTVKIESNASSDEVVSLQYGLGSVIKQQPNRDNFVGQPSRMKWHYRTQRKLEKKNYQDTTKIQKWFLKKFVEKPVLYDRTLMEESTESMTYLLNNLGYFYADVTADTVLHKRKPTVEVIYTAKIRRLLTIDTTVFVTDDDTIRQILPQLKTKTFLRKGQPVSKTVFGNEKNRITKELENMGFTYFYPNYVFFEGDTTEKELKAKVIVTIARPTDTTFHQRYTIGNVYIYTQYDPLVFRPSTKLDTLIIKGYDGFHLLKSSETKKYLVKYKPILNAFAFKKGDRYSKTAYDKTRRQLSAIEIYQFVRVRSVLSPEDSNSIDFYVYMNPAKKMGLGTDFEFNYISPSENNINLSGNNFGFFQNINFKHRNLFRGAEVFTIRPVGGIEINFDEKRAPDPLFQLNTIDFRVQANLATPTIRNSKFRWINESKFNLTTSYNYISRINLYKFNLFSLAGNFDWKLENRRHVLTPAFVSLVLPNDIDSTFQLTLDLNPLLASSFDRRLIFGSNYIYQYSSPVNSKGISHDMRIIGESAGLLLNGADFFIQPAENFEFFDTISYSQYVKLEFDYNWTKRFNKKTSWASRFNFGLGVPWGNSTDMPYVKQFFAGGDGSIRAWQVREVGPGRYIYPFVYDDVVPFQTGNLKIELNTELRFKLNSYYDVDAAIFADAGNVWLLNDPEDFGRQFQLNSFFKQIAIGTGFGFRKDFGFFVMRLDLGYKVRTPYYSETNQYRGYYLPKGWWRDPNYVLAIGYPF
ncbi:MAG: BamA/TamA family outer membrane protein [Saprospiraceae bacterium]